MVKEFYLSAIGTDKFITKKNIISDGAYTQ